MMNMQEAFFAGFFDEMEKAAMAVKLTPKPSIRRPNTPLTGKLRKLIKRREWQRSFPKR